MFVGAPQKPICANAFLKILVHYDAGVIELRDAQCCIYTRAAKLNFNFVRKRTFASYIRSLTRASRYTPVYASTYIIVTMKSMELDRTEPPTSDEPRAARFARRNKSSLNFRCSAIPSAGPPSNAMGVKRSNCGRTEAVLH